MAEVDTPVYKVLTAVLETTSPDGVAEGSVDSDESTAIFSYRECEHFNALWKMVKSLPAWLNGTDNKERTIVISWDGMPDSNEGTINVADYVTPFDWALALSWALIEGKIEDGNPLDEKKLPNLRILILDLKSQEHLSSLGVRTFTVAGRALPWVHTYRPIGDEHLAMAELPDNPDDPDKLAALRPAFPTGSFSFDHMIKDLVDTNRLLMLGDDRGTSSRADVEMLIDLWKSNLTRAGDRHHVGNLLAPLLLAEGLPPSLRECALSKIEEDRPLRSALRTLVEVIGLAESNESENEIPDHIGQEAGGIRGLLASVAAEPDPFDRKQNVRFGLIDDQYKLGFHHILDHLLFGNQRRGNFWCRADASELFETLRSQPAVEDWSLPRYLDLDCDVLLLDLRLWTREDGRHAFFRELLSVCEALGVNDLVVHDSSFERAFNAAKQLVSSEEENGQGASEIKALTLLPLLLSHFDPSLPIILFSSTQQRAVVEMTAHRPNILTGFSKPILSGYGEGRSASASLSDLVEVMRKALDLHEARHVWEQLPDLEWTNRPTFYASSTRYNAGEGPFADSRLKGNKLKKQLARYYTHYILGGEYYDFASVPYETLESSLPPLETLQNPDQVNFKLDYTDEKNCLGHILQNVRNRKAHAHLGFPSDDEIEWYRYATVFLFMLLLDYITVGRESPPIQSSRLMSSRQAWHTLRSHSKSLLSSSDKILPSTLTTVPGIAYLRFITYCTVFELQGDNRCLGLSPNTFEALLHVSELALPNTAFWVGTGPEKLSDDQIIPLFTPRPFHVDVFPGSVDEEGNQLYFAIVLFSTHEEASHAYRESGGETRFKGERLYVNWSQ